MLQRAVFHSYKVFEQSYKEGEDTLLAEINLNLVTHPTANERGQHRNDALTLTVHLASNGSFDEEPLEMANLRDKDGTSYGGPVAWMTLRNECEKYARRWIGPQGRFVKIDGGGSVSVHNSVVEAESTTEFWTVDSPRGGGW